MGNNHSSSGEAASSSQNPFLPNTEIADEEGGLGMRTVPQRFTHIPGTEGLSWQDDFFDGRGLENVIAVFDRDVENIKDFYGRTLAVSYCICASLSCLHIILQCAYDVFHNDIPWEVTARTLAIPLLFYFNILFNLKHGVDKCEEYRKGQHIAVTTEGLMTVRFDLWMLMQQEAAAILIPRFVINLPLPEPKISKFRYDEIRSCENTKFFSYFTQREATSVTIKVKGRCLPLYGECIQYSDALVGLINHLKEESATPQNV